MARTNSDPNVRVGSGNAKIVAEIHVQKGRYIKALLAPLVRRLGRVFNRNEVTVALRERVVHLIDDCRERATRSIAEEDAERVEAIAEGARHAEKLNAPAGKIDAGLNGLAIDLYCYRSRTSVAMIAVLKAEKVGAVVGKPS